MQLMNQRLPIKKIYLNLFLWKNYKLFKILNSRINCDYIRNDGINEKYI